MAAEAATIPLLTPYKLGKFNLSHRYAIHFCKFFIFLAFVILRWSELSIYVMGLYFVWFLGWYHVMGITLILQETGCFVYKGFKKS